MGDSPGLSMTTPSSHSFDLLAFLSQPLVQKFEALARRRVIKAGQYLYMQGEETSEIYRVKSGSVRLSYQHVDGRELTYFVFREADCFGFCSMLDGDKRRHNARISADAEIQVLDTSAVAELRKESAEFDSALLHVACSHLRAVVKNFVSAALEDSPSWLARRLLEFSHPCMTGETVVTLSQEELGHALGSTRQSINGILQQFQREGIIRLAYGRVYLENPEALRQLSSIPH